MIILLRENHKNKDLNIQINEHNFKRKFLKKKKV